MNLSKNLYICIYTHVYENCIYCIYTVYIHAIYTLFVYIIYTYRHPRLCLFYITIAKHYSLTIIKVNDVRFNLLFPYSSSLTISNLTNIRFNWHL